MKEYEVIVTATMSASVYVRAESEDEAYAFVEDNLSVEDYCNETCGFDFNDWYDEEEDGVCLVEIRNTTLEDPEIYSVEEGAEVII